MKTLFRTLLAVAVVVPLALPTAAAAAPSRRAAVIVVLDEDVSSPAKAAAAIGRKHGGTVKAVYRHALKGFSGSFPEGRLAQLRRDPRVRYVERDGTIRALGQTVPTGIRRVDVDSTFTTGTDVVDADIAVLDTGVDLTHPDLYVYRNTNCTKETGGSPWERTVYCEDGTGNDGHGHGTHVAGTAAAKDNDIGVIGVAPGARVWGVKVLGDNGSGKWSWIIAGVDYVAANAGAIDVANMSIGGQGYSQSLRDALAGAVAKGVVFAVAAGNETDDVYGKDGALGTSDDRIPAAYPEVAAISALADSDGEPGGLGASTSSGSDDSFASFSNYSRSVVSGNPVTSPGKAIDLLLPGVSIYSTYKNGTYATASGTSMASPHGAGLAARYVATNGRNPDGDQAPDADDVRLIRQALIDAGKDQASGLRLRHPSTEPDTNQEKLGWVSGGTVTPGNTAPDAVNDSATTLEDTPVTVAVLSNDTDADGDALSVTSVTQPAKGAAAINTNGTITYTPSTNTNGADSFSYTIGDGNGGSDTATVSVTVSAVNDAPSATNDAYSTGTGTTLTVAAPGVLANDADVDGNALSAILESGATSGALALNADGSFTYTPNSGFSGTDSFAYRASDGTTTSDAATVTITVSSIVTMSLQPVAWDTWGGKFGKNHLAFTLHVTDPDGAAVSGASVSGALTSGGSTWTFSGTTGSDGRARFELKNAPSGTYTVTVADVVRSGFDWDDLQPANSSFTK